MLTQSIILAVIALSAASANAGLLPVAAHSAAIVAPYASSYNAHTVNHAVAQQIVGTAAAAPLFAAPARYAAAAPFLSAPYVAASAPYVAAAPHVAQPFGLAASPYGLAAPYVSPYVF